MSELLNSLTSDNLVLLCVIMGVIALFLAIAISVEIYNNNKRYQKLLKADKEEKDKDEEISVTSKILNIKEDSNIKYVDEDSELEKTKAKIELANLREKLKKEEEEKSKLIEMNLALSKKREEQQDNINDNLEKTIELKKENIEEINNKSESKVETTIVNNTENTEINKIEPVEIKEERENKEDKLDETLNKLRVSAIKNYEEANTIKEVENNQVEESIVEDNDVEFLDDDYSDEKEAIISYEELKNAASFGYTDEEMDKYVDEKDAIISIQELEKLYKESLNIEVEEEKPKVEFEMKRVEDLPKISEEKIFQSTPFISPVYGTVQSETDLVLEQTANLEKLNEEIRKTNEFLKTLKDLKKNLQ